MDNLNALGLSATNYLSDGSEKGGAGVFLTQENAPVFGFSSAIGA